MHIECKDTCYQFLEVNIQSEKCRWEIFIDAYVLHVLDETFRNFISTARRDAIMKFGINLKIYTNLSLFVKIFTVNVRLIKK